MGSADVNTLHLQYWFLGAGFVWALAGLLSERAPAWILWPFVLLLLVAPRLGRRFTIPEADLLLDFFFVAAAVLLVTWLHDSETWRLALATILLCGMVLTKREGLLLAAFLVVATLLASLPRWRSVWRPVTVAPPPRSPSRFPGGSGTSRTASPGKGRGRVAEALPTENTERLWPSLRLALDVLFAGGYWSVIVPVAIGALILAAFSKAYTLGCVLRSARHARDPGRGLDHLGDSRARDHPGARSEPHCPLHGCGRAALLRGQPTSPGRSVVAGHRERWGRGSVTVRFAAALAIVLVPLLGYPLVTLAGDAPRFPTEQECGRPATADDPSLDVVYGRLESREDAQALLEQVLGIGFTGAELELDGCGRWKVFYDPIESLDQGEALVEQARDAGFDARVEVED